MSGEAMSNCTKAENLLIFPCTFLSLIIANSFEWKKLQLGNFPLKLDCNCSSKGKKRKIAVLRDSTIQHVTKSSVK